MIKNILLDLDGTVIDSSDCVFYVYKNLFSELGIPVPDRNNFAQFIGPPVETMLKNYLDGEKFVYAVGRFREIYDTADLKNTNKLYPGMQSAVDKLRRNYRVYVATSKNESKAKAIVELLGLDGLNGVYGSRFDVNRYRKSDVIDALIKAENIKREETVLVGDTFYDAEGAKEANVKFAFVTYGFGKREDVKNYDVMFFADSPAEIAAKTEEYNGRNH